MLSEALLKKLAAHVGDPVVTSLYLDVDGRRAPRPTDLERKLEHLERAARRAGEAAGTVRAVEADLAAVRAYLGEGLDRSRTRGLALFSCQTQAFFEAVPLPVAVRDEVSVDVRPHVAQLAEVLQADRRALVVLADNERARLLRLELGEADEQAGPTAGHAREVDTAPEPAWFASHEDELLHRHLRAVAAATADELATWPAERVVLAGPAARTLEEHLAPAVRDRIVAVLTLRMLASTHDVALAVQDVLAEADRRREASLLATLGEHAAHSGVTGLRGTLEALASRRVATLVVARDFHTPGARCPACGHLGTTLDRCPWCHTPVVAVSDVVEAAIDDALAQDASVEFVGAAELDTLGRVAVITRY